MTLQDLGNVGEFVAAIGVVVSLIYLAFQIRQNTGSIRASTEMTAMTAWNQVNAQLSGSADLAELLSRGSLDLESLDRGERTRFHSVMMSLFNILETFYRQYHAGALEADVWNGWEEFLRQTLRDPGVRAWAMKNLAIRSSSFRARLQDLVGEIEEGADEPLS